MRSGVFPVSLYFSFKLFSMMYHSLQRNFSFFCEIEKERIKIMRNTFETVRSGCGKHIHSQSSFAENVVSRISSINQNQVLTCCPHQLGFLPRYSFSFLFISATKSTNGISNNKKNSLKNSTL